MSSQERAQLLLEGNFFSRLNKTKNDDISVRSYLFVGPVQKIIIKTVVQKASANIEYRPEFSHLVGITR